MWNPCTSHQFHTLISIKTSTVHMLWPTRTRCLVSGLFFCQSPGEVLIWAVAVGIVLMPVTTRICIWACLFWPQKCSRCKFSWHTSPQEEKLKNKGASVLHNSRTPYTMILNCYFWVRSLIPCRPFFSVILVTGPWLASLQAEPDVKKTERRR